MKALKKLTGETAIYGVPSIVGRFLNWWLTPYWTYTFTQAQTGEIINVYSYVAFLIVILTYGLETGYFRFASKEEDKDKVFSTSFISIIFTTLSFVILLFTFKGGIADFMQMANHPEYILIMGITIALDIISAIPFAKLRIEKRPIRFAIIKLINIGFNIFFNLFFLSILPWFVGKYPETFISNLYDPNFGIGYVFISNLIASLVAFILLIPHFKFTLKFDFVLWKKILSYSFPIFIVGITGMINMQADKILIPKLLPNESDPMGQLGIYGANFKLAVLLNMFIQAFRFAFEPFFFNQKEDGDSKKMYALVLKYFSILGLIIFVGMSSFVDIIKVVNAPEFRVGIGIVPIVLLANFFMGVYFTLSLWYKLSDKTRYGAYMGIVGSIITLAINFLFIPVYGFYASAFAILVCFIVMTVLSYFLGQKFYPIPYDLKNFFFYLIFSIGLVVVYWMLRTPEKPLFWLSTLINLLFLSVIYWKEKKELIAIIKN